MLVEVKRKNNSTSEARRNREVHPGYFDISTDQQRVKECALLVFQKNNDVLRYIVQLARLIIMPAGRPKGTTKTAVEKQAAKQQRYERSRAQRKQQASLRAFLATGIPEEEGDEEEKVEELVEQIRQESTDYDGYRFL